jgi:hypothetical protein
MNNVKTGLTAVVVGAAVMAGNAMAAIDVTAATTAVSDALVPIATLGGAALLVIVAIKTWKWVRRGL